MRARLAGKSIAAAAFLLGACPARAEDPGSLLHDIWNDGADDRIELPPPIEASEPRVFYLRYGDGQPPPKNGICTGSKTPPPYTCTFGGAEGVDGCKKQIQSYLDRWYADFNIIFTLQQPDTGAYYTEVISTNGAWCGFPTADGPVGISEGGLKGGCEDRNGGTCFALLCGTNAQSCATIVAQEQAHLVGLMHTDSKMDAMYPAICPDCSDGFEDRTNNVVGSVCRPTQNSYQLMKERLGVWPTGVPKPTLCMDAAPPTLKVVPEDGAVVPREFTVMADAADDCGMAEVQIQAGGRTATTFGTGPYEWLLSDMSGAVTITVTAIDKTGKSTAVTVTVMAPPADVDGASDGNASDARSMETGGGECSCRLAGGLPAGGAGACLPGALAILLGRRRRRA